MKEITKELLHKLYIDEQKSGVQIAKELEIGRTTVSRLFKRFNIQERTIQQASAMRRGKKLSPQHRLKAIKTLRFGLKGSDNPAWKGGRTLSDKGYVWIKSLDHPYKNKQGYVSEHRLVMEKHIGRYLSSNEHIHHLNENRRDNRIENLRIVTNEEHMKLHWEDKDKRKRRSEFMISLRKEKFWSTKKL